MQRQSSHAGRGVEGLGHRDENRAGRLEPFDELRKVGEGTGQPVDLVDHDLLDETGIDVVEQARRCCTALAESEIRLWWWPRYVRA